MRAGMRQMHSTGYLPSVRQLICMSLMGLLATFPASGQEEPDTGNTNLNSATLPEPVQILLKAQGNLEAARCLQATLSQEERQRLTAHDTRSDQYLERIYPACRAILSATLEDRVCASLHDAFRDDLAERIHKGGDGGDIVLVPEYPDDIAYPEGVERLEYGKCALIDADPLVWMTPGYWGRKPQPPVFAGWTFESNMVRLAKGCAALIRSDFKLDDAEVTGEVRVDDGESIFMILRSDVIVKFHSGKVEGSGGNLNVKFGYDNLRTSSVFGKVSEIAEGQWYPFRIVLKDQHLEIHFDGREIINTVIARDTRIRGSKMAHGGHFGFGSNRGEGAFRSVYVKALSVIGRHRVPRLKPPSIYSADGPPVQMLEGKVDDFISLVHTKTEPYKSSRHPIQDDVLSLKGAPYVQFSSKDVVADHFKATGRIRFLEEGAVWFRVSSMLLFGLRSSTDQPPFAVKHTTGNFHYVDEENAGDEIELNRWYTWELEYREPVGTFRLDDKNVIVAMMPADRDKEKSGPNQFGISSYNTSAEICEITFQKLAKSGTGGASRAREVAQLFEEGFKGIEQAVAKLGSSGEQGAGSALEIIEGRRPPVTASTAEFRELAESYRKARDWPMFMNILESNYLRFDKDTQADLSDVVQTAKAEAKKTWKAAGKEYEAALKSVKTGELGIDNILRTGDKAGLMLSAKDGRHTWIFIPKTKELLKFNVSEGTTAKRIPLKLEPVKSLARRDYFLFTTAEDRKSIHKVTADSGEISESAEVAKGRILDMVPHPKKAQTFVCVDENTKGHLVDFSLYRIYVLDESSMQFSETDAIGMFLCPDPLGRYLYSGFHAKWSRGVAVETAFLRVRPQKGHIDHLVRYRLTPSGPLYDGQRAAPGIGGSQLLADPRGKTVCYLSEWGFVDIGSEERREFGIAAFRATDISKPSGIYDAGSRPELLEFNPIHPEAYVYTGGQVRRYNTESFQLQGAIPLPPAATGSTATQLLAGPGGSGLLIAYAGKPGGVYVQRFGYEQITPALTQQDDPSTIIEKAKQMIAAGDSGDGRRLLCRIAETFAFTEDGEQAAEFLLKSDNSPYVTPVPLHELPEAEIEDMKKKPSAEDLTVPEKGQAESQDHLDPVYGDNDEFGDLVDELLSLKPLADEFPNSWLWRCHESEKKFPGSMLLKIEAASILEQSNSEKIASTLAGEMLEDTEKTAWYRFRAYSLLARIYGKLDDSRRQITALSLAAALYPRDSVINARLAEACDAVGCPKRATHHKLVSWHLFPSQPDMVRALTEAGILPWEEPKKMDTADLFRVTSSAVVLISHEGGNGTGFVVSRNGLLLTNHHVVEGAGELTVKFKHPDGGEEQEVLARVVAFDALRDVALLYVDPEKLSMDPLVLGNSTEVKTGDKVVAIGNPGFGSQVLMHTATEGIISGEDRAFGNMRFFQISAAVNPGNSGGPLLNESGEVIGMVTLKAHLENVGFALPSSELMAFIKEQETR
jgi:S1-C subfamily serine protease